jgi:hypothetical protein
MVETPGFLADPTFTFRSLHIPQPFLDFLCNRRGTGLLGFDDIARDVWIM